MTRKVSLFVSCCMLLLLSSCQTSQGKELDPRIAEQFSSSEAVLSKMDTEIQDVAIEEVYDDVTFKIDQTLGDGAYLYVILDVIFPEHISLKELASNEEGRLDLNLIISNKEKEDLEQELSEMSETIKDNYDLLRRLVGVGMNLRIESQSIDYERNQISYIVEARPRYSFEKGQPFTLLIPGITYELNGEKQIIAQGPFVLSWPVENTGTVLEYTFDEDDSNIGRVQLSTFGLVVELRQSAYRTLGELGKDITITLKDGTVFPFFMITSFNSTGEDHSGGEIHLERTFPELLDISAVATLQIGEDLIDVAQLTAQETTE